MGDSKDLLGPNNVQYMIWACLYGSGAALEGGRSVEGGDNMGNAEYGGGSNSAM